MSDRGGKIKVTDIPLFAALASASGQSQDRVRQLAKLACPLLTRLVLHHNQIAEVREQSFIVTIERMSIRKYNSNLWQIYCRFLNLFYT